MHQQKGTIGTDKPSHLGEIIEFLGGVIGSAISAVYQKYFTVRTEDQHIQKTTNASSIHHKTCSSREKNIETSRGGVVSEPSCNILRDLLSNSDCLSYEEVRHAEKYEDKFLNISNVSGVTARSLSNSNVPSSGTFRAELNKNVSIVSLPSAWRDIPVKNITERKTGKTHRAFDAGYTSFFSEVLKKFNPYCCWIFKRNYIKKENSRKRLINKNYSMVVIKARHITYKH